MKKIVLTTEGHKRLQDELQKLKAEDRPMIIRAIAEARAHGDLSENAEYHSAKERQGFIETRIRELEGVLSSPQIIDPSKVGADGRCIFGAYVDIADVKGKTTTYRLVGEYEADIDAGLLSIASPLGRALIGKYADETVAINPGGGGDDEDDESGGGIEYKIIAVRYQ